MNALGKLIVSGSILFAFGTGIFMTSQYADYSWPFTKNTNKGRTKNSISAVIGGTVAKQLYDKSEINLEIEKKFWPNAHVTGYTTEDSIVSNVNDLAFTKVNYNAEKNAKGNLQGIVKKSEYNWDVEQTSANKYHIDRASLKFNSDLELKTQNGKITGTYIRHGLSYNWPIEGTYDTNGNVKMHVNVPWGLDFNLEGNITQK
jgi:hypothetical protein